VKGRGYFAGCNRADNPQFIAGKDLMDQHDIRRPHSPFQFIAAMNRLPQSNGAFASQKDGSINAYGLASPRNMRISSIAVN
jgi:hypothetical protein